MAFVKLDQADLDSPRQELSNGGLKSVVTLLVCWQINFLSAQTLTLNPAVWMAKQRKRRTTSVVFSYFVGERDRSW